MVDQLEKKRVPWPQIEKYIKVHQGTIVTYLELLDHQVIGKSDIETKVTTSFLKLHEVITQILTDNDILPK